MNEFLIAVILGIVEGVTEFLPVSSTGHLILTSHVLEFTGRKASTFQIFIQLGAILAVVGYFRQRIWELLRTTLQTLHTDAQTRHASAQSWRFLAAVMLAFFPAAMLGFLIHDELVEAFFAPKIVAYALILGGAAILLIERFRPTPITTTMEKLGWGQALVIGLAQCLALIPGVSRSASTIMGGLVARLDHAAAAEFSFFLAIPTMFAATLYSLAQSWSTLSDHDLMVFAVGLLVSFIVAWMVIAAFMAFIKRHSFAVFGWYRIVFGLFLLLALGMKWI